MSTAKKISIIIPVYNSQENLQELSQRLHTVLNAVHYSYEILFIDDCSKDKSWNTIIEIKNNFPNTVKGIRLAKNAGQHLAIMCGLSVANGDIVITMDDDLQHPPEEIPKLISKWEETDDDVVYGLYDTSYGHGKMRGMASNFAKQTSKYSNNTFGSGSSFRLMSRKLIDKIIRYPQQFVFIDEIIYWHTTNVSGVQVEHHQRKFGKSNYSWFRLFKLYLHIVIHFTALPLQLMIWGGIILSIFTFLIGVYFILKKLAFNVPVEGYTSLIVAIMFSTSLMLVCFGIIGKYIYQVFQIQNGKPPYTIGQII